MFPNFQLILLYMSIAFRYNQLLPLKYYIYIYSTSLLFYLFYYDDNLQSLLIKGEHVINLTTVW